MEPVKRNKFNPETQYPRHPIAYKEGGIHNGKVKSKIESSVFSDYMKQISKKVMKGELKNMNSLSKPAKLCVHTTVQEAYAIDNEATQYLDEAQKYTKLKDPVKRLQNIAAFTLVGIPLVPEIVYMKAPLDPATLGESCQLIKQNSKTFFTSECVKLYPPVIATYITSEDKSWKVSQPQYSIQGFLDMPKMNSISGTTLGKKTYSFREEDGTYTDIIESTHVQQKLEGILVGERLSRPTGSYKIIDEKNKLECEIKFEYVKQSTMQKLGGLFKSKDAEQKKIRAVEAYTVQINKVSGFGSEAEASEDYQKVPVSNGTGNYMEYLEFDGELLWTSDMPNEKWVPVANDILLKSDCSNRESKLFIQMEDWNNAIKVKNAEEKQELDDVLLRKNARTATTARGVNQS